LIMRMTIGRAITGIAAIAAIALAVWSFLPAAISVETATVSRGHFVATVDEDGKAQIRERYTISAPLGGRLTRILLKAGDTVRADDSVATIAPAPSPLLDPRSRREAEERLGTLEAAVERAKAGMERAQAQFDQAKTDLERVRTLVATGASTAQALERAELAMRVADRELSAAQFQSHAAEHEQSQARALLARYQDNTQASSEIWTVTAPVGGVVLRVLQESETVVQSGAPLLEIGDTRDLEVVVDVLSTDAVDIRPGADVVIDRWGGSGTLAGRVRRVEPAAFTKVSTLGVEEQRVNVRIDLTSPAEQWVGLGDGYQVDARITVFAQDNAIIVPTGALFRRGDSWHAFVVKDGRAEDREFKLVRRAGRLTAVAEGLSEGDRVIVYPGDRVASGIRVKLR
jgi:HlyD family secretion protein